MTAGIQSDSVQLTAPPPKGRPVQRRGRLTIFLGMASGVGKTRAMLQSASREKSAGRDVVIGFVETNRPPVDDQFIPPLPQIPPLPVADHDSSASELDFEAVIARRPQLVVIDQLAHSNSPGLSHRKRYQDIQELLETGIDVFTTLNIQNVSSRADAVRQITGIIESELVPDSILDGAEIQLVDLPPERLIARLAEGASIFSTSRPGAQHKAGLSALREMTIRLAAERVGHDVRESMRAMRIPGPWKSGHSLLVSVGPGAAVEQLLRWTCALAESSDSPWTAAYIETAHPLAPVDQAGLARNLALARELGAEVITTTDASVADGLLRVAKQRNATQIIAEKPSVAPLWRWFQQRDIRRLIRESGEIDVHLVRVKDAANPPPQNLRQRPPSFPLRQYVTAVVVVLAVTLAAFLFTPVVGAHSTALIFLLTVVLLALFVGRGPTLVAATMSALLWDYFFLPPVYAFRLTHFEDAMLLGMYFVVALVLGQLTARIRAQEEAERQREQRATALYLLTRELTDATSLIQIVQRVVQHTQSVFKSQVAVLLPDPVDRGALRPHPVGDVAISPAEKEVAAWVFEHGQSAGRFTDNHPLTRFMFVPLATRGGAVGVIGLRFDHSNVLTIHQRNLLEAFSRQIALALDRQRLQEISENARLLVESERLGKTLLNSVSHEIRTPIAAIKSATSNLVELAEGDFSAPQRSMIAEIQEATERLNRLVGNVLDITRLESGAVKPKLSPCDLADLIHVSVKETKKQLAQHKVSVQIAPRLPLASLDFVLMQQALVNLLSNAAFHTPVGTSVRVHALVENDELVFSVADDGPGIEPASLPRIFDKFYRAPGARTGGTGLGLSLVKGFVEAQNGTVAVENAPTGGTVFTIRLPIAVHEPVESEATL